MVIQWHISAMTGSAREVASGSVRTRVYVTLLRSVGVGVDFREGNAWISNMGAEETSEGTMALPRFMEWCEEG